MTLTQPLQYTATAAPPISIPLGAGVVFTVTVLPHRLHVVKAVCPFQFLFS